MIPHDTHLQTGSLLFADLDQIDLTGPFEVLSHIARRVATRLGITASALAVKGRRDGLAESEG